MEFLNCVTVGHLSNCANNFLKNAIDDGRAPGRIKISQLSLSYTIKPFLQRSTKILTFCAQIHCKKVVCGLVTGIQTTKTN